MNRSFVYYVAPSLIQAVFGIFVMVPLTTYYLEPADIGLVALLIAIVMPLDPLTNPGDSWVLSGNWQRTDEVERKVLVFNVLATNAALKVMAALVCWIASSAFLPLIVKGYRPEYQTYFGLILAGFVLSALWPTISHIMVLEEAALPNSVMDSVQWLAGAAVTIAGLAWFQWGVLAMFLSPIAAGVASTIMGLLYVRSRMTPRFSRQWIGEIARKGTPAIPFSLVAVLSNSVDRIALQRWYDLSTVGFYAHSQSYRSIFVTGTKAYVKTVTPLFVSLFGGDPARCEELHIRMSVWYAALTVWGVVLTLFSNEVVHVLTHGKFDAAGPLVPIWFLLALCHSVGVPFTQFLLQVGQNALMSYASTAVMLASTVLVILMIRYFGMFGGAVAIIAGAFGLNLVRLSLARRHGYTGGLDRRFLRAVSVIGTCYFLNMFWPIPLPLKLVAAATVIVVGLWFLVGYGRTLSPLPTSSE